MPVRSDPNGWRDPRHRLGLWGERIAVEHLRCSGWRVLEHRFRLGRLEVDLVARRGSVIAFVEVKTRLGAGFGSPLEAVTHAKRRELARVASAWVDRHGRPTYRYRFDVIGITVGRDAPRVEHVADAFWPGWR